jgi:hypothetical protein
MVNRTYADMARHCRTAIVPARPYKPRDKAKVEVEVQVVGRWILARLWHRRFFSLADLNAAIRAVLDDLNDRPMRGWGTSRRALYDQLDRPAQSWLACAFGHKPCREGFSVLDKRASRLFGDLTQARGQGRLPRLLATLERVRRLIIDDWGPAP